MEVIGDWVKVQVPTCKGSPPFTQWIACNCPPGPGNPPSDMCILHGSIGLPAFPIKSVEDVWHSVSCTRHSGRRALALALALQLRSTCEDASVMTVAVINSVFGWTPASAMFRRYTRDLDDFIGHPKFKPVPVRHLWRLAYWYRQHPSMLPSRYQTPVMALPANVVVSMF